jgi:predicted nuclease of restriction endonuclease-like (RecB) superfamily
MKGIPLNYQDVVAGLKEKIRTARLKVAVTANNELLKIFWEIGATIISEQKREKWGAKVVDRLAADLKMEFPDFKGLSVRNLKYMKAFAEAWPDFGIVQVRPAQLDATDNQQNTIMQAPLAQLTWYHHTTLLDKIKDHEKRLFYIQKAVENGWSRDIMVHQIETNLFERTGKAISNFKQTLPALHSDLAQQTIKNPYIFDFLSFSDDIKERELEKALIENLKKFMLELGKGFAYVGNQKNVVVDGDDFFLDLLFYNYHLRCFVVFELKMGDFKPEYAGKLNFYVNTINEQLKGADDKPTIGVLLCKTPNETVIKYSLQGIEAPIGVANYQLAKALPKELKGEMPTIEELEQQIDQSYEALKTPVQKKLDALKEKLAQLKGPEAKLTATTEILFDLIDKSLMPLFQQLLKRGEEFKELFHTLDWFWEGNNITFTSLEDVPRLWKDEAFLKNSFDLNFRYRLSGLIKAGTKAFSTSFEIRTRIDTYHYGIMLVNYNNQQPFIKKVYGEQLTEADMATIVDTAFEQVIENIEYNIKSINENK